MNAIASGSQKKTLIRNVRSRTAIPDQIEMPPPGARKLACPAQILQALIFTRKRLRLLAAIGKVCARVGVGIVMPFPLHRRRGISAAGHARYVVEMLEQAAVGKSLQCTETERRRANASP
ncbi:hypothetical protein AB7M41_004717 [Bradyrhizobium diazoefficiens]